MDVTKLEISTASKRFGTASSEVLAQMLKIARKLRSENSRRPRQQYKPQQYQVS
jgi:hypothetical protein